MPKTFNGKSWGECVSFLREARPPKKDDDQGYAYVGIEQFFIYMDKVFDGLYSYSVSEPYYMVLANGQEAVNCTVQLDIFDDEGNRAVTYGGAGSCRVYYNKDNRSTNLDRAFTNASTAAFKEACKGLGIFGFRRLEEKSNSAQAASRKKTGGGNGTPITFHSEGEMFEAFRDKDDRPVCKLGGKVDGKPSELIFYAAHYEKDAEKFNRLRVSCKARKLTLDVSVSSCGEREGKKQYVFLNYN